MNKLLENSIINKYKKISFDIFDTLIERDVLDPLDIFSIVENETGELNFRNKRIQAEKEARRKSISKEVTLGDIYREYQGGDRLCNDLRDAELRIEEKHIHVKESIYSFYQRCISENRNVFLVSDMYLTTNCIENILRTCNIRGYKKLYISCEYNKNKVTSELFGELINSEHINKKDIIHIGDSPKADLIGARKAGIHSILIPKKNAIGWVRRKIVEEMKIKGDENDRSNKN